MADESKSIRCSDQSFRSDAFCPTARTIGRGLARLLANPVPWPSALHTRGHVDTVPVGSGNGQPEQDYGKRGDQKDGTAHWLKNSKNGKDAKKHEELQQQGANHSPRVISGRDASRQPIKTKNESSDDDEEAEDERANAKEWANRNGNSANGPPTANGKQTIGELTKYDRYLYSAVISTFMHVHKSTTISKLHNYLSENYSNGNLFRSVFPDQAELLEFVRANCKNIRCTEVSANEIALLWSEDSEQQMVRLLLKVGKVLMINEVAYAD
uniref:MAGE domain-containing protein n=1 Tax=Globodera pallida TaxID=36090 RepID=A0A183BI38_GLOPA